MNTAKSNESIVAEAMVSAGAPLMHSQVEESVVGALVEAGRLYPSVLTDEQREALGKAFDAKFPPEQNRAKPE